MTVIIFLLVLSVLVLAHEWGHFVSAKKAGARVEEFGFGFPPRIFSWERGGTVFSINIIPFGGFVKIFGESGGSAQEQGSFTSLKIGRRAVIISAGVLMNLVLAWLLLSAGNLIGRPTIVDESNEKFARDIKIQILEVQKGSPAETAGFKGGDIILGARLEDKDYTFSQVDDFQSFISENKGREILFSLKKGERIISLAAVPRASPAEGEGALGVGLARIGLVKTPWYLAIWKGLTDTLRLTVVITAALFLFFKTLIVEGRLMGEVAGPVGIATITGQAYTLGWAYLIQLTAILSINLAILNILPFPALDGGRLLFLAIEKIKGSPLNQKFEQAANAVGFSLLILLMLWVTWRDIVRLF